MAMTTQYSMLRYVASYSTRTIVTKRSVSIKHSRQHIAKPKLFGRLHPQQ